MGRCESAECSLGIKIQLKKLIEQLSSATEDKILKMLNDGFVEDSNGYYNEVYGQILGEIPDDVPLQEYLRTSFQEKW